MKEKGKEFDEKNRVFFWLLVLEKHQQQQKKTIQKKKKEKEKHTNPTIITQSVLSHVIQLNRSLTAAVHEEIALSRMEFSTCDHFSEFFHVWWLNIKNI